MATGLPAGSIVGGDDGDLLAYETPTGSLVWETPDGTTIPDAEVAELRDAGEVMLLRVGYP